MSTALAKTSPERKPGALALMAQRISVEPAKLLGTLKNTVFKGASDDELLALVVTANEYQLNPILKEMYAFPQKGGGIVPVVGIDGWLKIINRQPNFDGMSVEVSPDGQEATCRIHLKDRAHPVEVTEYLSECSRNTDPWKSMPKRMLRHKAIIQAARVAFGIGGIHDEDEAKDIARGERNVTPPANDENPFDQARIAESPPTVADDAKESAKSPPAPSSGAGGSALHEQRKQEQAEAKVEEKLSNVARADRKKAYIENYQTKTGKKTNGEPWTLHIVELNLANDGGIIEATTFSDSIGSLADFNRECWAWVELRPGKKEGSTELASLDIIDEEGGADE